MTASGTSPARLLRVYGLWIVLVTALVSAAAVGVGLSSPVVYTSEATVVVEARVRQNTTPVAPDMGTEKELARSGLIINPAASLLAITPGELLDGLAVGVAPDANVLTFDYTAESATSAARRASAVARAYVAYRNGNGGGSGSGASQRATLVTDAVTPQRPEDDRLPINAGVGAALGLLLGVATAVIRDRLNDRLRGRADLERVAGVPVVVTVPRLRGRLRKYDPRPIILRAPDSAAAEAFRYLRSRVQPAPGVRGETILVTSAVEQEGRTTTAINLATALALSGRDVVLVDTDFRRPGVDSAFGVVNGAGVTSVLAGEATVAQALRPTPVPHLRLLTAGPATGHAVDLLEGAALARLLAQVRGCCEVVVLDSAPVLSVADPVALAGVCDHVLIVADHRRTTRDQIAAALRELGDRAGRRTSAVLLNTPAGTEPAALTRSRRPTSGTPESRGVPPTSGPPAPTSGPLVPTSGPSATATRAVSSAGEPPTGFVPPGAGRPGLAGPGSVTPGFEATGFPAPGSDARPARFTASASRFAPPPHRFASNGSRPTAAGFAAVPTRPDSIRPDGTRPDSTRPDGTRPDSTRPDGTRPDAGYPDPVRPAVGSASVSGRTSELDRPPGAAAQSAVEDERRVTVHRG